MRWSGQTESDLKVGDCWPTGGRLGGCFAHYGPQRNSFHHTEIFFLIATTPLCYRCSRM